MKLYHTTDPRRLEKIESEGLKINSAINKTYDASTYIRKAYGLVPIFLSTKPGRYKNGAILEVDVTGLELVTDIPSLLDHDGYVLGDKSGIYWEEMVDDPKADLIYELGGANGEVSFKTLNDPNSEETRLAIQITETCAVKQDIPPDRIRFVGFVNEQSTRKRLTLENVFREEISVDIDIGDTVLGGRFKNKKIEVKKIGKDDINQPTINDRPLLKYRIKKDMPDKPKKMNEQDFGNVLFGQERKLPTKDNPEKNTKEESKLLKLFRKHYRGETIGDNSWIEIFDSLESQGEYTDILSVPNKFKYAYRVMKDVSYETLLQMIGKIPKEITPGILIKNEGGIFDPNLNPNAYQPHSSWTVDVNMFSTNFIPIPSPHTWKKGTKYFTVYLRAPIKYNRFILNPEETKIAAKGWREQKEIIAIGPIKCDIIWYVYTPKVKNIFPYYLDLSKNTTKHVADHEKEQLTENSEQQKYKTGMCDAYALALNEITNKPIYVVRGYYYDDLSEDESYEDCHMVIRYGKDSFMDVNGLSSTKELIKNCVFNNKKITKIKLIPVSHEEAKYTFAPMEGVYDEDIEEAKMYILSKNKSQSLNEEEWKEQGGKLRLFQMGDSLPKSLQGKKKNNKSV